MSDWKDDLSRGLENMFTTQEMRENGTISTININDIIPFQQHTFRVNDDAKMMELIKSIKEHGVMMPAIAFVNEDGRIELVAGHRRLRACQLAGLETMPVIIREINRDEATIIMGETNLQAREEILPSEKAYTYRNMLEAMKRQGKRTDLTSAPVEQKLTAREKIANKAGESQEQIRRYIRLTYLEPELLQLVDEGKMSLRPAVEISYISSINQQNIYAYYEDTIIWEGKKIIADGVLPSLSQAKILREEDKEGTLDEAAIADILDEAKPNQREKVVLKNNHILNYGRKMTPAEFEKHILKALDFYEKYKNRVREERE